MFAKRSQRERKILSCVLFMANVWWQKYAQVIFFSFQTIYALFINAAKQSQENFLKIWKPNWRVMLKRHNWFCFDISFFFLLDQISTYYSHSTPKETKTFHEALLIQARHQILSRVILLWRVRNAIDSVFYENNFFAYTGLYVFKL